MNFLTLLLASEKKLFTKNFAKSQHQKDSGYSFEELLNKFQQEVPSKRTILAKKENIFPFDRSSTFGLDESKREVAARTPKTDRSKVHFRDYVQKRASLSPHHIAQKPSNERATSTHRFFVSKPKYSIQEVGDRASESSGVSNLLHRSLASRRDIEEISIQSAKKEFPGKNEETGRPTSGHGFFASKQKESKTRFEVNERSGGANLQSQSIDKRVSEEERAIQPPSETKEIVNKDEGAKRLVKRSLRLTSKPESSGEVRQRVSKEEPEGASIGKRYVKVAELNGRASVARKSNVVETHSFFKGVNRNIHVEKEKIKDAPELSVLPNMSSGKRAIIQVDRSEDIQNERARGNEEIDKKRLASKRDEKRSHKSVQSSLQEKLPFGFEQTAHLAWHNEISKRGGEAGRVVGKKLEEYPKLRSDMSKTFSHQQLVKESFRTDKEERIETESFQGGFNYLQQKRVRGDNKGVEGQRFDTPRQFENVSEKKDSNETNVFDKEGYVALNEVYRQNEQFTQKRRKQRLERRNIFSSSLKQRAEKTKIYQERLENLSIKNVKSEKVPVYYDASKVENESFSYVMDFAYEEPKPSLSQGNLSKKDGVVDVVEIEDGAYKKGVERESEPSLKEPVSDDLLETFQKQFALQQKQVIKFKLDQTNVSIYLQRSYLQLSFNSPIQLFVEGIDEYVSQVMDEHGIDHYRVEMKDRQKHIVVQSKKDEQTSRSKRSVVDVKV